MHAQQERSDLPSQLTLMVEKSSDADYKARKAKNSRAYYERNKEVERAKTRARAASASTAPAVVEHCKQRHREAQARYRKKQAAKSLSAEHTQPARTEQQKQRHRDAQARYREKNREYIQLMQWVTTKKGLEFKINMLQPVDDEDLGSQNHSEVVQEEGL